MAEQVVELNPAESRAVSFEAIPHEVRVYQVSVDGLTGSFKALAPPEPSALLVEYQKALDEAYVHVEAGYPNDWVMIPGYGLQYAGAAVGQLEDLMRDEAVRIGMIGSRDEAYFDRAIMYHVDDTTIVPYWWPCPYCPEKLRSPALLEAHKQEVHWDIFSTKGVIVSIWADEVEYSPGWPEAKGIFVRWRNDSPFAIRGHVAVRAGYWRPDKNLTASIGQDAIVEPGGYATVYFPYGFTKAVMTATLTLVGEPLPGLFLDYREHEWEYPTE